MPLYLTLADEARFWSKVQKSDGCWTWTASKSPHGYGTFGLSHRNYRSHRFSWELHFGPIPAGMHVCHRCDNPPCIRPDHLFLGTQADNIRDMHAKGRAASQTGAINAQNRPHGARNGVHTHPERVAKGERVGTAKLSPDAVLNIKRRYATGETQHALGHEYGVSRSAISLIVLGKQWKHLQ